MFLSRLTRLNSCCWFLSLKLGCLIIGYIEIAGNSLGLYRVSSVEHDWEDILLYILGAGLLAIVNVLLVWGIHKERKKLLLPWLITKFIGYLGLTIYYGIKIVEAGFLIPQVEMRNLQLLMLSMCFIFVLLLSIAWYTFFCVYSFYKTGFQTEVKVKTQEEKKENQEEKKKEKKDQ